MRMVTVPVLKRFTHEGRELEAGETVMVSPVTAAALHRQGYVSLTRGYQTKVEVPEIPSQAEPEAPTRRRRYRRRDMNAESA